MSETKDSRESSGGVPPNFSEMLDRVLANPEIISTVAAALSKSGEGSSPENEGETKGAPADATSLTNNAATPPDMQAMMQKLPDVMRLVGPMMSKGTTKSVVSHDYDKRNDLLSAIKPYMSPHRCEAIDYIIKFSELSELIKKIY